MVDLSLFDERLRCHLYDDVAAVARVTMEWIIRDADAALRKRGAFHLVLAGGSTPKLAYQLLVDADTDWSRWHIYYGDERCLPVDDPERNSVMAQQAWLDHVAIPKEQIHPIPAELGAEAGAMNYAHLIEQQLPFDTVLLGMGEDGHTASLFPGHLHDEQELVHEVHNAPKPPSDRVSLSRAALSTTRSLLLLVTGSSKQVALSRWAEGASLPVASIAPECGIDLFLDKEAVGIVELP
ncbi:MAG: 6-phosphogluconolactonase [Gammaproteobacteria bacterium]|nr:6-phosphogluconolactonase [Gammaproteobacteria bacterium]